MSRYGSFAEYYDSLTSNVDYSKTAEYVSNILNENGINKGILLDLACGTGTMSLIMAQKGYDVIGVDNSPEMLGEAREKACEAGEDILFLCQDMCNIDLYGTVDCTVCLLDSLNHLESKEELLAAFQRVSLFTVPGGLFVFDVNTEYKHKYVLGDNTFVYENDDVYCVWQNEYDDESKTVEIFLDFFQEENGLYRRSSEYFSERAFSDSDIKNLLSEAGFTDIKAYGELRKTAPSDTEERIFYVARKD